MCVLLIEDEVLIRSIMVESLQDAGFDVYDAGTAEEAQRLIDDPPMPFSVLVTDVHLSGDTTGIELADRVRQRWPSMPVIVATGRPDAISARERRERGYILLRKPYGPRELVTAIRHATEAPSLPQP
jgi:DNA-binding NtrC family response regulator